jgi:hypothetical protein
VVANRPKPVAANRPKPVNRPSRKNNLLIRAYSP